jgi:bifunctional non-homologous end joining protein LigD
VVLDGEAVVLRPDATSDFFALRSSAGQARAVLAAFDLLELDAEDLRANSLERRRMRLQRLLKTPRGKAAQAIASGIQLSEPITGRPDAIFRHACTLGLEGIVSKRIDSRLCERTDNDLGEGAQSRFRTAVREPCAAGSFRAANP